jgi:alpha-tubulin suppressor-like RCC1 family protein
MALPTPIPRREIILDVTASTTAYAIPFPFIYDIDIEIAVSTVATPDSFTTLVYPSGYTLSGAGNPIGGTAHLTAAPEIGGKVRIRGIAAENASEEIIRGIRYNYLSIERALLRLGWGLQEVNRDFGGLYDAVQGAVVDLEVAVEAATTASSTATTAATTAGQQAGIATAAADRAEQIAGFDPALYMLKASAYTKIEADAAITTAVNALVAGAPGALDTLQELSAALGNDAAFGATVTNALTNRLRIDAAQALSSAQKLQALANLGVNPIVLRDLSINVAAALPAGSGSGGYSSGAAIMSDGSVRMWGAGAYGQLGQGANLLNRYRPIQPAMPRGAAKVSKLLRTGYQTIALTEAGTVYVWGRNNYGTLGVGNTAVVPVPTKITVGGEVVADVMTCGFYNSNAEHVLFLTTAGNLYGCGYNGYGQLGLNDTTDRSSPTLISGGWKDAKVAAVNYGFNMARKADDSLWMWGINSTGQLGQGITDTIKVPTKVNAFGGLAVVAYDGGSDQNGGYGVAAAILSDGSLYTWGYNGYGQLGLGNVIQQNVPQQVVAMGNDNKAVLVAGGQYSGVYIRKTDDRVFSAGYNGHGQLGVGDTTQRTTFTEITGAAGDVADGGIKKMITIGGASTYGLAILYNSGRLRVCGHNANGNLGIGTAVNVLTLTDVPLNRKIIDICPVGTSADCGIGILTEDGAYYQTGPYVTAQLPADPIQDGNGANVDQSSYVPYLVRL